MAQTPTENPPAMWETLGSIPGEDPPEEEMANPLQCSCLENPMDGGAWRATVHGVAKSYTTERHFVQLQNINSGWFRN